MPIRIKNWTFYYITEAAAMAGISRSTLLRWIDKGSVKDAALTDVRGWRLFSGTDIRIIRQFASKTNYRDENTMGRGQRE